MGLITGLCDTVSLCAVVFGHPLKGVVLQTTLLPPSWGINAPLVASNQSSVCAAAVQGATVHCTVAKMWAAYLLAARRVTMQLFCRLTRGRQNVAPRPLRCGVLRPPKRAILYHSPAKKNKGQAKRKSALVFLSRLRSLVPFRFPPRPFFRTPLHFF